MPVYAIVLAAGEGTRMRSQRPKPLHLICGRPMVLHVIHSLKSVQPSRTVVVVGFEADRVRQRISTLAPAWAHVGYANQPVQRGTGDAVRAGLAVLDNDLSDEHDDTSTIVVLPGDTPLLRRETIDDLVTHHESQGLAATVLVSEMEDPTGYGRVVRAKDGRVTQIVEHRDASPEVRAIKEVNTSIYAFRRDLLGPALRRISPQNAQAEYYLTDVIAVLSAMGHRVGAISAPALETQGVNDRWQLAQAEGELRSRTNRHWLLNGVTMLDPQQTFIDTDVDIGQDVTLYPGTILQGRTTIGSGCDIGPNTRLVDCTVGDNCRIDTAVAHESTIGNQSTIGPYAFLASGTTTVEGSQTGAFYDSSRDTKA